ncbi:hypothetical protein [Geoalkalibacter sp.]|uniref:hypothetical protein n=1 Tax=Geoalkalibacter sp. TaxID=3041440 RepID=UPI00272E740A|nr:hypothetical protein [Geoalkalibacter sp.]
MSFGDWIKQQLANCAPVGQEVVPAGKDSVLAFWACLRRDWAFFGICGIIVGLMRWVWPSGFAYEASLPQQLFSGLVSSAVLGVFLFAALMFIGLSSLLPRDFLLGACDQAVLRVRQFAGVMTAFLAGYGVIALIHGVAQGLPLLQELKSVALYVLIIPIFCVIFTAPAYFRGRLCGLLAWILILAGLLGIFLSVRGV